VALDGVGWDGGGAAFEGGSGFVGAFECSWVKVSEVWHRMTSMLSMSWNNIRKEMFQLSWDLIRE